MRKIELLAPAGNFECLIAAVQNGADAVYLAGKNFGARSFADNFGSDEIEKAVDYCHIRGVNVYVTVNTLVLDDEFEEVSEYLKFLASIGVDAVIVQDIGVMKLAEKIVPELPVHASTQMTIHNSEGVEFLKRHNVKRVVLARELSLKDISKIAEQTDVELEVFGHGALCMCYSGQCLLSSIIGGRSGNRGKCAQPCRLPYTVNRKKNKSFLMSLKDLSSLDHIRELSRIGVASLKIEGRMKGPAYVAAVTRIYRKYIDNPQKVSFDDYRLLDSIFNRGGLTDGYLTEKTGKHMFALQKPDNPYLKGSSALEKDLLQSLKEENRKLLINGNFVLKKGKEPVFSIWNDRASAEYVDSSVAEEALKSEVTDVMVLSQLKKTGGTPYEFGEISTDIDSGLFISAGALNKIRRAAIDVFEKNLINSFKRKTVDVNDVTISCENNGSHSYVCEVLNIKQFSALIKFSFEMFYVPIDVIRKNPEITVDYKEKIIIVLPAILREKEKGKYITCAKELLDSGYHGIQIQNPSLLSEFSEYNIYGGFRLNVFNSRTLRFMSELGMRCCELSPELTMKQIRNIDKCIPTQVMVYGRLPLTVSENCLVRNGDVCPCNGDNYIIDRMGMRFPVIKDGDICRSVILNCKKTFMGFDMDKIIGAGISCSRLYFSDETPEECIKVCDTFLNDKDYRPDDFTNGHFFKGVAL